MTQQSSLRKIADEPKEWLSAVNSEVDSRLRKLFSAKEAKAAGMHAALPRLVKAIRELTLRGGKRLRPSLLAAAFRCVAPDEDWTEIMGAAVAAELLQTFLLIHDDWMDQAETRRGGPSVHIMLGGHYGNSHLGDSAAILAGDLAAAYAWESLTSMPLSSERIQSAICAFWEMEEQVAFGQFLDVVGCRSVETIHLLKSASYSVRGPLRIGAKLGGATEKQLKTLDCFAIPLGVAFQLRDDLLGTFGDPEQTGKPVGNDLRTGKMTALIADAMQNADKRSWLELESMLKAPMTTPQEIRTATTLLERCGSRDRIVDRLRQSVAQATAELADSPLHVAGVAVLRVLAESMAAPM